jgi:proteasome lid subunit RPN8/RPN11
MTMPVPVLLIPLDIHNAMVAQCVREAPNEACGLLAGHEGKVTAIYEMRNELQATDRYNADPKDLIRAFIYLRTRRLEIVALYHSHPKWPAVPSKTDLAENRDYGETPRIIVSLLGKTPEVRVWRFGEVTYDELPWRIVLPGEAAWR